MDVSKAGDDVWCVDAHGWLTGARRVPSPNFDARPSGCGIDLLVIHAISLPPGQFTGDAVERFFLNQLNAAEDPYFQTIASMRVSAHFLIRRDGQLMQFVSCQDRAWHAGVSSHEGRPRCNDFSIGVELEGTDCVPFESAQYQALASLTTALRARYPLSAVRGHCHIAPERKTDPGPYFDWGRYANDACLPSAWCAHLLNP